MIPMTTIAAPTRRKVMTATSVVVSPRSPRGLTSRRATTYSAQILSHWVVVMVGPPPVGLLARFRARRSRDGGDLLDGGVGDEDEAAEEQDGNGDRHSHGSPFGSGLGLGELVAEEGVG